MNVVITIWHKIILVYININIWGIDINLHKRSKKVTKLYNERIIIKIYSFLNPSGDVRKLCHTAAMGMIKI